MSVFTAQRNLTLTDWATRVDPDGKQAVIAELLNSDDQLLDDIAWVEATAFSVIPAPYVPACLKCISVRSTRAYRLASRRPPRWKKSWPASNPVLTWTFVCSSSMAILPSSALPKIAPSSKP